MDVSKSETPTAHLAQLRGAFAPPQGYRLGIGPMRKLRIPLLILIAATLAPSYDSVAAEKTPRPPAKSAKADAVLLPPEFSGWTASGPAKALKDAADADPANAAALKEYGFTDGSLASYQRGGETLTVKALRFVDAS